MTEERGSPASGVLARRFVAAHPHEAARVVERYGALRSIDLLHRLPPSQLGEVLKAMDAGIAADCLAGMDAKFSAGVLGNLDLDETTLLLRRLEQPARQEILDAMPEEESRHLARLLAYPPDTAGAWMDPKVRSIRDDLTAGEALEQVRASPHLTIYYLYLVHDDRLTGVINLRELMLAAPETSLGEVMVRNVDSIPAGADRSTILAHPGWAEYHALPVVDGEGRYMGALRYETLRRLEGQSKAAESPISLAVSLGELYWMGLSGILQGLGHVAAGASGGGRGSDAS